MASHTVQPTDEHPTSALACHACCGTKLACVALAIMAAVSTGRATITFERIWDYWRGQNWAYTVQQVADGGFVVGASVYYAQDTLSAGLIRTDSLGDTLWSYLYLSEEVQGGWGRRACDGTYGLLARPLSGVLVVKVDSLGDSVWARRYSGDPVDIAPTADSGFVVTGVFEVGGQSNGGLLKLASDGTAQWVRLVADTIQVLPLSTRQTDDGGYIMSGECEGTGNLWVAKTDSVGNVEWTYCRATYDPMSIGCGVLQTRDGGYAVTGPAVDSGAGLVRAYIARLSGGGDTLWTRRYTTVGFETWTTGIVQTDDGGFAVVGQLWQGSMATSVVYAVRTDSLGDTLWSQTFDGASDAYDFANDVVQTADGGFAIAGYADNRWIYLIKTDSLGLVYSGVADQPRSGLTGPILRAFPNPFSNSVSFCLNPGTLDPSTPSSIRIYDNSGRLVRSLTSLTWDAKDAAGRLVSPGIYFCRVTAGNTESQVKLVVTH